jgi:peptide deformylase
VKEKILQAGHPLLRKAAKAVSPKDITSRAIRGVLRSMQAALRREEYGVAIAAPQIGESLQIFLVAGKVFAPDGTDAPTPADKVFINPKILRLSKKKEEMSEGCLSVRNTYGSVLRHEKATIQALDEKGAPFVHHGTGLIAQIFQHEMDHLKGILYTDKALRVADDDKEYAKLRESRRARAKKHA